MRDFVAACQSASDVSPGKVVCGSGPCSDSDAERLACPRSIGGYCADPRPGEGYYCPIVYLNHEITRMERASKADACCYGEYAHCNHGPVP